MADIFISYSSKDREKAEQLTELLASAGLSVWIDHQGIGAAASWSGEIVDAIENCKAFVILLSPSSVESVNVIKEVALAAEKRKKILPLDLEPVALSRDLQYHLAGIQRSPMTNIDAIIRALEKLGLEAISAPSYQIIKPEKELHTRISTDDRKSLMILPFEDLSPTADNEWFTNGIVSELIQSLSVVKALRVMDAQTTKEFKTYKGHLTIYAKEMRVRYFVQGDVRKFGDQIKINSRLLDIETGEHLWQDSLKGTMDDIFDIQETVAKNVAEGLKIILTQEEKTRIEGQLTENADAYELYLKAKEYYERHTRSDLERSIDLFEEAIRIDPKFAGAHVQVSNAILSYYRNYSHDQLSLDRVQEHIDAAESLLGESAKVYWIRGILFRTLGQYEKSQESFNHSIELDPNDAESYNALSMTYALLGDWVNAVAMRKRHTELLENDRNAHYSYTLALRNLEDREEVQKAAKRTQAFYERYLRLTPEDIYARVQYVSVMCMAGEKEHGLAEARSLEKMPGMDAYMLFNLACVYLNGGDLEHGYEVLRRSIENGYRNIDVFMLHPDLKPLHGTREFEVLMRELEEKLK